ncbi:hypothetical protein HJ526_17100 [Donghicola sp. C2-DW-16]|uniref:HTH DNA binding domain-containing protein n=1 Tax=Donghicola mangrovi TaxID=2729614 RepID=A0ABX2PJ88_9RHOB|nr:hypothetical protein [Donghicola mangrovi]NVO29144.1 hypothetical protein [Donghicola mangrovi]
MPQTLDLIALEATAGRIEGIFSARPDLARLWRVQAALIEAARTVAMEDIHIHEGDLIFRLAENLATSAENARGVDAARDSLAVLRAPGSLIDDPERVIARICRASVQMEEVGQGGSAPRLGSQEINRICAAAEAGVTPFMSALRAAATFRQIIESWSPSADRLVFIAAEHSVRQMETRPWGDAQDDPFGLGLLSGMSARWTFLPATALTQGRFRSWSPMQPHGVRDLIEGLRAEQSRTLGAIPLLERWVTMATGYAAGKHGKSRLKDLVTLATYSPILTVSMIREGLGLKQRAAFNLVDEAEAAGILTQITARKTYRIWAVPSLADRIRSRPMPGARGAAMAREPQRTEQGPQVTAASAAHDKEAVAEREAQLLSTLDAALERVDALLKAPKH